MRGITSHAVLCHSREGGIHAFGLILWDVVTIVSMLALVKVINSAVDVFGSQAAYVMTIAGIIWSMLLLGETLSSGTWAALGVICIGLLLVEPKHEAKEEIPQHILDSKHK